MPEKRLDMVGEGLLCGDATADRLVLCVLTWEELRVVALGRPLGCGTYVLTRSQFR